MPKITFHGGPSNKDGEDLSPGKNSPTSTVKPHSSTSSTEPVESKPAPTTESPSVKRRAAASTARGTGGGRAGKDGRR